MAVKWTAVLVKEEEKLWVYDVYRNDELISTNWYKSRRPTEEHVIKMARRDWRFERMRDRGTAH